MSTSKAGFTGHPPDSGVLNITSTTRRPAAALALRPKKKRSLVARKFSWTTLPSPPSRWLSTRNSLRWPDPRRKRRTTCHEPAALVPAKRDWEMVCSAVRRLRFFLSLERISKKFVQSNPGIAAAIIMVTSDAQSSIKDKRGCGLATTTSLPLPKAHTCRGAKGLPCQYKASDLKESSQVGAVHPFLAPG